MSNSEHARVGVALREYCKRVLNIRNVFEPKHVAKNSKRVANI